MSAFIKNIQKTANKAALTEVFNSIDEAGYKKLSAEDKEYIQNLISSFSKKTANMFLCEYLDNSFYTNYEYQYLNLPEDGVVLKQLCDYHKITFNDEALKEEGQTYSTIFEHLGGRINNYSFNEKTVGFALDVCSMLFDGSKKTFSKKALELFFSEEEMEERLLTVLNGFDGKLEIKTFQVKEGRFPEIEDFPLYLQNILSVLRPSQCQTLIYFMIENNENYFNDIEEACAHPVVRLHQKNLGLTDTELQAHLTAQLLSTNYIDNFHYSWNKTDYTHRLQVVNTLFAQHGADMLKTNAQCLNDYLTVLHKNMLNLDETDPEQQITYDAFEQLFLSLAQTNPTLAEEKKAYLFNLSTQNQEGLSEESPQLEKLYLLLALNKSSLTVHKTHKI